MVTLTGGIQAAISIASSIHSWQRKVRRHDAALYGSGYARAFAFDGDEAIDSLQAAQCIAHDPKRYIDQFTQPEPAFAPTRAPQPDFSSRMQNTGAYWLLQALKSPPTPTVLLPGSRHLRQLQIRPRALASGYRH